MNIYVLLVHKFFVEKKRLTTRKITNYLWVIVYFYAFLPYILKLTAIIYGFYYFNVTSVMMRI